MKEKEYKEDLDIQKITGWPKVFIKNFSASIGSHKDFVKKGEYCGTPLQLLPIVKKPFLKYGTRFHLFCPYIFNDHFYRNIQSTILKDQPDYSEIWNKKQAIVSEQIPFDILTKIMGYHKQIRNFHYKIKRYKSSESWFEMLMGLLCLKNGFLF